MRVLSKGLEDDQYRRHRYTVPLQVPRKLPRSPGFCRTRFLLGNALSSGVARDEGFEDIRRAYGFQFDVKEVERAKQRVLSNQRGAWIVLGSSTEPTIVNFAVKVGAEAEVL